MNRALQSNLFRILGGSPDHEINSSRRRTGFLFSNNATQGQGRNKKKQARIKWVLAGTVKEPAGENRDKQGQNHNLGFPLPACPLLALFVPAGSFHCFAYPNHVPAIPHFGFLRYFFVNKDCCTCTYMVFSYKYSSLLNQVFKISMDI